MKGGRWFSPETLTRWVMRLISLILASFLILLANKVIDDLGSWIRPPSETALPRTASLIAAEQAVTDAERAAQQRAAVVTALESALSTAQRAYDSENESYGNWLKARTTVGSPQQDPEVLKRVQALDARMAVRDEWQHKVDSARQEQREAEQRIETLREASANASQEQSRRYTTALNRYQLKMFAYRLAIVLPILLVGVYLFVKFRKHRYAALAWGYILFSVYAFFFGVVPYLPSYGGYVRYSVGILLTVLGGTYAIRNVRAYAERQQKELQQSQVERAQKISDERAVIAYRNHACPSCDTDFKLTQNSGDPLPGFCFHCGLRLFAPCKQCGCVNFAHFAWCRQCGASLRQQYESPLGAANNTAATG